jgi:L-lactate dehydrogenase complex protein LldG
MTNPIIESIRRSLGRTEQTALSSRPAIFKARVAESLDSETELFLDEVRKLSGVAQKLTPDSIVDALKSLVTDNKILKATICDTPFLEQLGLEKILRNLGVAIVSPTADKHELALCDLGITAANFLLPETGTLVLRSSTEEPRAVSLLPRIHLAIVKPEMLRPDLHQVFAECKGDPLTRPGYFVFITGPSRTADIELTVTLGVHGPKFLYVWMLD